MESMNISLPDPLKRFVEAQISSGRYGSVSEYMRELIRLDEKRKAQERLEGFLMDGLSSSVSEMKAKDWDDLRKNVMSRRAKRSSK